MKKGILLLLLVSMLASIVIGCDNESAKENVEKIKGKINETVGNEQEIDDETAIREMLMEYAKALLDGVTYENVTGLEGYEYFTPEYRQKMIDTGEPEKWASWYKENKVTSRLGEVTFDFFTPPDEEHPNIAAISASFQQIWREGDGEEKSGYANYTIGLLKVDGVWKIANMTDIDAEEGSS